MDIILPLSLITLIELIVLVILLRGIKKKKLLKIKNDKVKEKFSFKKIRLEQWIIFSVYAIVFCILGYFFLSAYAPNLMKPINSGGYVIDGSVLEGVLQSFYFENDVFGEKVEIDGEEYLPFESEAINKIIFSPKKVISESSGVLSIEGLNNGTSLYIEDKLVVPDLSGYIQVKDYSDSEVYVRDDYSYSNLKDYDKLEDYLYYNFPQAEVYSFKSLDDAVPVLMDYKMEDTEIEGPFRDNLNLVVYHGGGILRIRGYKQDLNMYVGKDEYTLVVKDFDGKEVYSIVLEDDGDKKDSKELGDKDFFSENINLERGIYYISFVKDENNPSSDSTIRDLKINSNKVLIKGKFLIYQEDQKFFTRVAESREIGFKYWWDSKSQKIYFTGDISSTLSLDEDEKSEWVYKELSKGDYYFKIEKGYLWVNNDYSTISEENWFDIPTEEKSKLFNPEIIVINKEVLKIEGNKFYLNMNIDVKEETKFQVLDSNKLFIKKIELKI